MGELKNGVYYIQSTNNICTFTDVEIYEDREKLFCILTWEYESGIYKKTLITSDQFKAFTYLGEL